MSPNAEFIAGLRFSRKFNQGWFLEMEAAPIGVGCICLTFLHGVFFKCVLKRQKQAGCWYLRGDGGVQYFTGAGVKINYKIKPTGGRPGTSATPPANCSRGPKTKPGFTAHPQTGSNLPTKPNQTKQLYYECQCAVFLSHF